MSDALTNNDCNDIHVLYLCTPLCICLQVTAQDISTMLRCGQKTIIFLINNLGYTIEVEIHDGPYNVIKNWNYTGLVDAIHNGEGKCWTAKVSGMKQSFDLVIVVQLD